MQDFSSYSLLVAVETDASRYHGVGASRPHLLSKTDADQLLAHISTDLAALLPGSNRCSLVGAGALFDQTQVLRPAYPIFDCLENTLQHTGKGHASAQSSARLLSIGASNNVMPLPQLQPEVDIPLGILQLLPLVLRGPRADIAALGHEMEHRFLEQGQLSAQSALWLETAFGIRIKHARFMTLTDLRAMFRLQLEHFGFLPLWQLIDAALEQSDMPLNVETDSGALFSWRKSRVHAEFQTFDHWAQKGLGKEVGPDRGKLAEGYANWTRQMRQYLTTLRAHEVKVAFHLPGEEAVLKGHYFVESASTIPLESDADVTEHSFADLGTVCVSHAHNGRLDHYYPLSPQGINAVHAAIRQCSLAEAVVAYPGSILYDEKSRRLMAESEHGQVWH